VHTCHPAGRHIWQYFQELSRTRGKHTIMIAGMGGSQIMHEPAAITHVEIAAWLTVTKRSLNRFENRCLALMDNIYLAAVNGGKQKARTDQEIGEYCRNKQLEKCKKEFGEGLARVCSTCPE